MKKDVAGQKQQGQTRTRNKERYGGWLDDLMEGCQVIDFDWRYVYVNDAGARHGHTTKEKLLGHTMMEVYPGIEQTDLFARLKTCMEKRQSAKLENEFEFPTGEKGWFALRVQPVPEGILILSVDITEAKLVAEAKALRDIVVERATDGIAISIEGKRVFVNKAFLAIHGLQDESQAIGTSFDFFALPEDRHLLRDRYRVLLKDRTVSGLMEYRIRRADGGVRTLQGSGSPIIYQGQPARIAIFRDITEAKAAEEALRESEEFNSTLLDNSPSPVLVFNPDTSIRYVNRATEESTGYSAAELVGKKMPHYPYWAPEVVE
ncbi:MAG: PAS domain S-box protein, partial [Chloroflexota bacterium]